MASPSSHDSCLSPIDLVAVDLGGTHARFAIAHLFKGQVVALERQEIFRTSEFPGFAEAWAAYRARCGGELPQRASIAVACPVQGDHLQLTNHGWTLSRRLLPEQLGVSEVRILNDFAAQSHAVAGLPDSAFEQIGGPIQKPARQGLTTIIGPGTGLGVGHILKDGEAYRVLDSEGGHIGFAPFDDLEDRMLARLRAQTGRVSAERFISGNGLGNIHACLLAEEGLEPIVADPKILWAEGLAGTDARARRAIDRLCAMLGGFSGDCVLLSGARTLVITGGIGKRLGPLLASSEFMARFLAKGRLAASLAHIPVYRLTHDEPGLYGAALAFSRS